jgi:hypothetical protein
VAGIGVIRPGTAGIAGLCGVVAALPYLLAPSGSLGALILVYLTQLPLFAAGLWLGVSAAVIAGVVGLVIVVSADTLPTAAVFAGLDVIPAVLLVRQALLARTGAGGAIDWYPPGLLSAWLTGLGLAVIAAALLMLGGPDGIRAALHEALAPALERGFDRNSSGGDELLDFVALILPGIIAATWMTMTVTNGILAQGLLARFGANWRPSPEMAALSLPVWISALLALATVAIVLGGTARLVGVNVMIVLAVPFCLAGLAVLHTAARRLSRPAIPLVTFYVLAGVFGWPLLLVALLGVLDSSLGLRRRIAQP